MRAYTAGLQPKVATAKAILKRIKKGDLCSPFSSKDVWRPCWSGLTDRGDVTETLQLLEDYHYLRAKQEETKGRTAVKYFVHESLTA